MRVRMRVRVHACVRPRALARAQMVCGLLFMDQPTHMDLYIRDDKSN